ncbi:nitroreductase family deazaflavin-dependent oxidoreductase [Kribbella sp. NBC_01484]|uniref:nitroreductase family deazaflavin-dependent oxidoreductase n=1 Tax=Kribbella sp. NBC_01484 TaxID=2903579 RepID=UPI002E337960|nr:nitroreductase family deazaflavin-dependent oxidoreductase [Kribbella sp. NBC_01484]
MTAADNSQVVAEFRANGGRLGGPLAGTPVLLLHHVGARTGARRVTPLVYSCHAGDRVVVVASNGGEPSDPAWLHNLRAHPDAAVEIGTDVVAVHAAEAGGAERDELWQEVVARYPDVGRFGSRTDRPIPLVVLRRIAAPTARVIDVA